MTLDAKFTRLATDPWAELPDISIDYAVMERATNLTVVPYGGTWSDLGDWQAVWRDAATPTPTPPRTPPRAT